MTSSTVPARTESTAMRVVLDTNIVVSALIWGGTPYRLLQLAQAGEIEILASPWLIAELTDVLSRTHLAARITEQNISPEMLVANYRSLVRLVSPIEVPTVVIDDPDDDNVLACAIAGDANLIVSGDKHILGLGGAYRGIPIVKAGAAVIVIEGIIPRAP